MAIDFPTTDPEGTIPVSKAKELTANWREYIQVNNTPFATHAFLVPIIAFKNILKYNPDAEGVRAYIGLENSNDPSSGKLVLVPVVDGNDVLYLPKAERVNMQVLPGIDGGDGGDDGGGDDDDPSNVYDLTKPCPTQCGSGGGLNGD